MAQDGYCDKEQVVVRARVRNDLERLHKWLEENGIAKGQDILKFGHADDHYWIFMPKESWAKYVAIME